MIYPKARNASFAILLPVLSTSCAAIFDGQSQQISVNTNPPGAQCQLVRNGAIIGTIQQTPGATTVQKSKNDIRVECAKPSYQMATYQNHSGVAGATYADIIGGVFGLVGWGIDSASGSDNKYDSPINISLVPAQAGEIMQAPSDAMNPAVPAFSSLPPLGMPAARVPVSPAAPAAVNPQYPSMIQNNRTAQ